MRNNREKVYTQVVVIKRKVYSYLYTDKRYEKQPGEGIYAGGYNKKKSIFLPTYG